jgi:hypothetical protein
MSSGSACGRTDEQSTPGMSLAWTFGGRLLHAVALDNVSMSKLEKTAPGAFKRFRRPIDHAKLPKRRTDAGVLRFNSRVRRRDLRPLALVFSGACSAERNWDELTMAPPTLRTQDFQRTTLGPVGRRVVWALAEAMFSPDGEVPPKRLDALTVELDEYVSAASKTLRFGLVAILVALRWSPLLFPFPSSNGLKRLDELPVDARASLLERLEKSRLMLFVAAYKTMLTMLFYEDESELRRIGYPGPERNRWKRGLPLATSTTSSGSPKHGRT